MGLLIWLVKYIQNSVLLGYSRVFFYFFFFNSFCRILLLVGFVGVQGWRIVEAGWVGYDVRWFAQDRFFGLVWLIPWWYGRRYAGLDLPSLVFNEFDALIGTGYFDIFAYITFLRLQGMDFLLRYPSSFFLGADASNTSSYMLCVCGCDLGSIEGLWIMRGIC